MVCQSPSSPSMPGHQAIKSQAPALVVDGCIGTDSLMGNPLLNLISVHGKREWLASCTASTPMHQSGGYPHWMVGISRATRYLGSFERPLVQGRRIRVSARELGTSTGTVLGRLSGTQCQPSPVLNAHYGHLPFRGVEDSRSPSPSQR